MEKKIFYVMGKSASGKDTLFKLIREEFPELRPLTIGTTRPIRDGESEGNPYHFCTDEEYQNLQNTNQIMESRSYVTINGVWRYFTINDTINMDSVETSYIGVGTLESFRSIKNYYRTYWDKSCCVFPIYISVPDPLRLKRAIEREDHQKNPNYLELCRRFIADNDDFSAERIFENEIYRTFVNIDLDVCKKEIFSYVRGMMR